MKAEIIPYLAPETEPSGAVFAKLSPDGWCDAHFSAVGAGKITAEERLEYVRMVTDFIRRIKTRAELDHFMAANGKTLSGGVLPTVAVSLRGELLDYEIQTVGVTVEFKAYPKKGGE